MAKKKKHESGHVVPVEDPVPIHHEHVSDDAVQLSACWIDPFDPSEEQEQNNDLEKHPKFAKFQGEK